jgi:hypothetical protein
MEKELSPMQEQSNLLLTRMARLLSSKTMLMPGFFDESVSETKMKKQDLVFLRWTKGT